MLVVSMLDEYGRAVDYHVKDECPKCKAKLKITGVNNGCYDGEWTYTHKITCENNCFFTYPELKAYNNIKN